VSATLCALSATLGPLLAKFGVLYAIGRLPATLGPPSATLGPLPADGRSPLLPRARSTSVMAASMR
jgi:hypothetical protein